MGDKQELFLIFIGFFSPIFKLAISCPIAATVQ
jgi:hypothetical protein